MLSETLFFAFIPCLPDITIVHSLPVTIHSFLMIFDIILNKSKFLVVLNEWFLWIVKKHFNSVKEVDFLNILTYVSGKAKEVTYCSVSKLSSHMLLLSRRIFKSADDLQLLPVL